MSLQLSTKLIDFYKSSIYFLQVTKSILKIPNSYLLLNSLLLTDFRQLLLALNSCKPLISGKLWEKFDPLGRCDCSVEVETHKQLNFNLFLIQSMKEE